jgi:superfamily II DNA or RNA helicase
LAGAGKTKMVAEVIRHFIYQNRMPQYLIYTCPKSAFKTIIEEFKYYNLNINILVPIKNKDQNLKIKRNKVNVIVHDHVKHSNIVEKLRRVSPHCFLVVDEFHLTLNKTKRTSIVLELARCSSFCIALSGTPFKDRHVELLIPWLQLVVDFEVNLKNLWTAAGGMISKKINLGIDTKRLNIEATFTLKDDQLYDSMMNKINAELFRKVVDLSYNTCIKKMVELTLNNIKSNHKVMLVARNVEMQQKLKSLLLKENILNEQVLIINKDNPVSLTPETRNPAKVIITTVRYSTGYNLTACSVMITSVYFTDQATREQLECRIRRVGQVKKSVKIITVHAGILSLILDKYEKERSLVAAIRSLAQEINIPEGITNF